MISSIRCGCISLAAVEGSGKLDAIDRKVTEPCGATRRISGCVDTIRWLSGPGIAFYTLYELR